MTGYGLRAMNDYPWFKLTKGDVIPITSVDKGGVFSGSLSWGINQLWEEIERGDWELLKIVSEGVGDGEDYSVHSGMLLAQS